MANLSITAADVQMTANTLYRELIAGEASLTAGMALYEDFDDGSKSKKAEAGDTEDLASALGIAISNADNIGDKIHVAVGGDIYIGATLTLKTLYVLSATSGLIAPFGDLVSGDWVTPLFVPKTTAIASLIVDPRPFQIP